MKSTPLRYSLLLALLAQAACGDDPTGPSVEQLQVTAGSAAIVVGDTTRLQALVVKANGQSSAGGVSWTSLDPGIGTINELGVVTGIKKGTARIVGAAGGVRDTTSIHVVPRQYNVQANDACSAPDYRTGHVAAVSKYAIVIADNANPSGGFTTAEYGELARTFDTLIYPVITANFGEPADMDGNGRVIIFYTRAVNEMTPAGSTGYVGGFFFARDLFPKTNTQGLQGCQGSNEAELFYMMVPDPNGSVNGNPRGKENVRRITLGTIAHEFQHLINGSRRLYLNSAHDWEESWLNEGLSHIAEELMFYQASGLQPRQNIDLDRLRSIPAGQAVDAFNAYQISNFGRLSIFFEESELSSGYSDDAELADRGAAWHYLRYIADRASLADRDLWFRLVNSTISGFDNLKQVVGLDPRRLYRDWAITSYTDDLVATKDSAFQQPSWNYRSIMPEVKMSLPVPRQLRPGEAQQLRLRGGGTSYLQFTVAADQRAEIRVSPGTGGAGPGACEAEAPPLALQVGEVHTPEAGQGNLLCVGGTGGGTYVVVMTSLAAETAETVLSVTGTGIVAPTPTTTLLATNGLLAANHSRSRDFAVNHTLAARARSASTGAAQPMLDHSVHALIRRQEAILVAGLGKRAGLARTAALHQQVPGSGTDGDLYVSLVRVQ